MVYSNLATPYQFQNWGAIRWNSRGGTAITTIVIHHMATTNYDSVPGVWKNREASAHYGIGPNGEIRAYVDEDNRAWHCGNGNSYSIGIENCNISGAPDWKVSDATVDSLVKLIKEIQSRRGKLNIIAHCDVPDNATACCGPCLYPRLEEIKQRVNSSESIKEPEPVKPKVEAVPPKGGIGVGTNVYATVPSLTSSRSPNSTFWITNYIEGALSPYELSRDGKVVAYTTRDYIQRVNKLPANVIKDGSNVIVNKLSDSCDKAPYKSTGYQTFWIAQYVDGNKKSAYRLVKNGITVGYTDRDNIQLVK
ncbi:N-acetylmuramoyl-L-alanine amidase [Carnobacterium maltaromaticum]|uniref:peptidoglycan recognition protein family protein n=1 Tax=Carnobacterium maltaromaticum TaxID=2751 RepID=UPI0039BE63BF